jgi:hypothetical protein
MEVKSNQRQKKSDYGDKEALVVLVSAMLSNHTTRHWDVNVLVEKAKKVLALIKRDGF